MVKFFLDKENKVPLYLQLKDQIKYYVSTGALQADERLPPIKTLAKELAVNFQTVRKAYRELELEGLAEIKHGDGTFISSYGKSTATRRLASSNGNGFLTSKELSSNFSFAVENLIKNHLNRGLNFAEAKKIVEEVLTRIEQQQASPIVVFTECNRFQIREISVLLKKELALEVEPMLISELAEKVPLLMEKKRRINLITTGFHVNEVRSAVGELPIKIDVLITNLNPQTRRELEKIGESGKYSFICRDPESVVIYKDLLKAELGFRQIDLTACTFSETEKVLKVLNSSDVVLVSPPVFEQVRQMAPPEKAVYNVFERVDPMSLKVVKDKILKG